ncbi:MAG TPA: hypothetical protein VMZ53_09770 [Kofleriaceae bacterium]|nr:hypothetical protein [Kofleriaceae bacterium]
MIVGCGGDDTTGPLPGGGGNVADSIGAVVTMEDDSALHIVIASTSNLCSDARANPPIDRKGQSFVVIELADTGGAATTAPSAPGTYTVYSNSGSRPVKSASFISGAFDNACMLDDAADASGQSGSIVLTAIGARFAGTYDVVLNTGDHVTGSFDAAACTELQTATTTSQHACN